MYTFQQYKKLPGIQKLDEKNQAQRYERMREEAYLQACAVAQSIPPPIINPGSFSVTTYVDGNQITDWKLGYVSPLVTTVSVDWGDGITSSSINPSSISHVYEFVGLSYSIGATVTISNFENLGSLDFSSESLLESRQITTVEGLSSFTSLTSLNMSQNLIGTINNGLNFLNYHVPPFIVDLNLSYNLIGGTFEPIINSNVLTDIDISHNSIVGFEASFFSPPVLKKIDFSYNSFVTFSPITILPASVEKVYGHHNEITNMEATVMPDSLNDFDFTFNALSENGLQHTLEDLNLLNYSSGTFQLQNQVGGNPPNAEGLIAKAALISRGCTVITD